MCDFPVLGSTRVSSGKKIKMEGIAAYHHSRLYGGAVFLLSERRMERRSWDFDRPLSAL